MVNFEFDCETELDARQEWDQHYTIFSETMGNNDDGKKI